MNLNRAVIFILIILLLSSCSLDSDENVRPITTNPFLEAKKCYLVIGNLIEEWKSNGGGYKNSIKKIREQIKSDQNSTFSLIVKEYWKYQKTMGIYEKAENIGDWPISDEKYRSVFFNDIDLSNFNLDGCSLIWLSDVLHDHVLRGEQPTSNTKSELVPPLKQFPKNQVWESNQAQLWLEYWVFAYVKE